MGPSAARVPPARSERTMPVVAPADLAALLRPGQPLVGLDVGSTTVGVAVSDATRTVASPATVIARRAWRDDLKALQAILAEREAGGVVIGLPLEMDGREGPRCQSVRAFAANLLAAVDLPVAFWDERLSTRAVERALIEEADLSRRRRREVVDKMAAAYILQGALDAMAGAVGRRPGGDRA